MIKSLVLALIFLLSYIRASHGFGSLYFGGAAGFENYKINVLDSSGGNIRSKSESGLNLQLNLGAQFDLFVVLLGIEGFFENSFGDTTQTLTYNSVSATVKYRRPYLYGLKGTVSINLPLVKPYLALGFGTERGNLNITLNDNNVHSDNYINQFVMGGLGIQAKIENFGIYGEVNYRVATKERTITESLKLKSSRLMFVIGLKYYFINR